MWPAQVFLCCPIGIGICNNKLIHYTMVPTNC
uniref:Uncharacterized protein n=1 Tax=Arundo donax TaxID=35708 RepID=A0A0A9ETH4_ARUDO